MGTKNIITSWSFRDGRDYVISLGVSDNSDSLSLKVTDRITAEEWSCSYDTEYIENLTQRTGSFKPFDVFVSMIKSSILKKSESVALELMNIDDLELLRTQRSQLNPAVVLDWKHTHTNGISASQNCYMNEKSQAKNSANSKKKYLIVTYVAEFDKVHYPIPLNYSGPPDPIIMQNNITKLKTELSVLRHAKTALEEEVISLKQGKTQNPTPVESNSITEDIRITFPPSNQSQFRSRHRPEEFREGVDMTHYSHPDDEAKIHKLMSIIQKLEEKIRTERADYHIRFEKLGAENDFLRLKVEGGEKYGIELKSEINQLEKQITSLNEALQQLLKEREFKGNPRRHDTYSDNGNNNVRSAHNNHYQSNYRDVSGGKNTYSNNYRNRCSSTESCGSGNGNNYRGMNYANKRDNVHDVRYGKSPTGLPRTRSVSPAVPQGRSRFQANPRSRSSSPARSPFNPTAYVNEKKLKQERMAQLRLENIKNRLQNVETSYSRSRSNSRESVATDKTFTARKFVTTVCSVCGLSCSGLCRTRNTKAKPPCGKGDYGGSPRSGCSPGQRVSTPRKANTVDILLSEVNNISRELQQKAPSHQRQQSPSPIRRSRPIDIPPQSPLCHRQRNINSEAIATEDVERQTQTRSNQRTNKVSASIIGNAFPGLLLTKEKPLTPVNPDWNRTKNVGTRNTIAKGNCRETQKDKISKRQISLEAKLSALHQFLIHKPTRKLKNR